jgi:hypothetical protein
MTDPFFKQHRAAMAVVASALHKLGPMALSEMKSMDPNISANTIALMQCLNLVTNLRNCGGDEVFKITGKGVRKFGLHKVK